MEIISCEYSSICVTQNEIQTIRKWSKVLHGSSTKPFLLLCKRDKTTKKKKFLGENTFSIELNYIDENNVVKHNIFRCLIPLIWMIL